MRPTSIKFISIILLSLFLAMGASTELNEGIDTLSPESVEEGSAILKGEILDGESGFVQFRFKETTASDFHHTDMREGSEIFEEEVTTFDENKTYEYQALLYRGGIEESSVQSYGTSSTDYIEYDVELSGSAIISRANFEVAGDGDYDFYIEDSSGEVLASSTGSAGGGTGFETMEISDYERIPEDETVTVIFDAEANVFYEDSGFSSSGEFYEIDDEVVQVDYDISDGAVDVLEVESGSGNFEEFDFVKPPILTDLFFSPKKDNIDYGDNVRLVSEIVDPDGEGIVDVVVNVYEEEELIVEEESASHVEGDLWESPSFTVEKVNTEYTGEVVSATDEDGETAEFHENISFVVESNPPIIETAKFIDDRQEDISGLIFDLNDRNESNIAEYSGIGEEEHFTNSTLELWIDLPVADSWSVSNIHGLTGPAWDLDLEKSETGLQSTDFSHDLSAQEVENTVEIENQGADWVEYNLVFDKYGEAVEGEETVFNVSSGSTESHTGVWQDDWLTNVEQYTIHSGQNTSATSTLDQQFLANQTGLQVENTIDAEFPEVDISSECSDTETAAIPSGENNVTEHCITESETGDWIENVEIENLNHSDGTVVYGGGINQTFTASQPIHAENTVSYTDLEIEFENELDTAQQCNLINDTTQNLPAGTATEIGFQHTCNPGEELSYQPLHSTDTGDQTEYNLTAEIEVYTDLTRYEEHWIGIPRDRLDNWIDRDGAEAYIDGRDQNISIDTGVVDDEEYVFIVVGEEHGNSSLSEGTYTAELIYYEEDDTNTGGGSPPPTTIIDDQPSDEYDWTVSGDVGEGHQSFELVATPGREFSETLVLENNGDQPVTLDVECISSSDACEWVETSVDTVELDTGQYSTQLVFVRGEVPDIASPGEDYEFSIKITDPSYEEDTPSTSGSSEVDFYISIDPIMGRLIEGVQKMFEWRSVDSPVEGGDPIPYPFAILPFGISTLIYILLTAGEKAVPGSDSHPVAKFIVSAFVFLLAVGLF